MRQVIAFTVFAAMAALAPAANAAPVFATSYSMPNGNTGSYNYWDQIYSGAGNVTLDASALSGGLGDLTDGVIAAANWNVVEAPAGNGPYVGWTVDPLITFNFAASTTVDALTIYVDDANGFGGVATPLSVKINGGASLALADPAGAAPTSFTFTGLNATGPLTLQLFRRNQWVFMSEVTFDGRASQVPEPVTLALLGVAMGGFAIGRRRISRSTR
jgi:hypothetical protein